MADDDNEPVNRKEFRQVAIAVENLESKMKAVQSFVDLSPEPKQHHDDHLYTFQSRERMKVLVHSIIDNAGKTAWFTFLLGLAYFVAKQQGVL